ncbi:MAG: flavin reductase family protein [Luteolibacter sp.]
MKTFKLSDLEEMEKLARVRLANSLPGPKPISLVGTVSGKGVTNIAPFSSVTHLGSSPALIGLVSRSDVVGRDTLSNILETGSYTINHVSAGILEQAHQCSARYEGSEFLEPGLSPLFEDGVMAPFVAEAKFRFGMELVDTVPIPANGTVLIVGRVVLIQAEDKFLAGDGSVDLEGLGSLASTALDTYFEVKQIARLPYAKAGN